MTVLSSTTESVLVHHLHPYYTYECVVSAFTVDSGPYSEVLTVTTSEDGTSHFGPSLIHANCQLSTALSCRCVQCIVN